MGPLPPQTGNIVEDSAGNSDVAGFLRANPQVVKTLKACLQEAKGHLYPGPRLGMGMIVCLLCCFWVYEGSQAYSLSPSNTPENSPVNIIFDHHNPIAE